MFRYLLIWLRLWRCFCLALVCCSVLLLWCALLCFPVHTLFHSFKRKTRQDLATSMAPILHTGRFRFGSVGGLLGEGGVRFRFKEAWAVVFCVFVFLAFFLDWIGFGLFLRKRRGDGIRRYVSVWGGTLVETDGLLYRNSLSVYFTAAPIVSVLVW